MRTIEKKMVILGSAAVGKTSLIRSYMNQLRQQTKPTVGGDFIICCINTENVRIKLQVWDTAGQEKYRAIAPMYYRNANVALLVFDLTRYNTFIALRSWVKELRQNVNHPLVLVVVGNKCELVEEREVNTEEAWNYAMQINATYHEISVMGNEGIDNLFLTTAISLVREKDDEDDTPALRIILGDDVIPSLEIGLQENNNLPYAIQRHPCC